MKIINICISNPYIEGFAYQENILTDYFLDEGLETTIIGVNVLPSYLNSKKIKPGVYSDNGKKIIRINCLRITTEFIIPFKLYKQLKHERPDIVFHHNLNCTSLIICTIYKIFNPEIILLVDNHADKINCSKNKFWKFVYAGILVRFSGKFASLFVRKFYGVTYSRCDYLHETYGIRKSKIDFLPIGADIKAAGSIIENTFELRNKHKIPTEAFVYVSGGKMGKDKGTDNLVKVINEIQVLHLHVVLVLFGSFNDKETEKLAAESKNVIYLGWCDHKTSLSILKLADVAVWPVHHTTLIEDAISVNTPLLIRKTRTTEHLIEGNGIYLDSTDYNELFTKTYSFLDKNPKEYFIDGCKSMREKIDYNSLARKVISDCK
jgi:glycosyltransferase involved in cell wall biosynthesis